MKLGDIVKYKNYIILFVIYIFTIGFVFYCSTVYKKSLYNSEINVNDVTSSDYNTIFSNVYNYSLEHSSFKIYVSDSVCEDIGDNLFIDINRIKIGDLNKLISEFGYSYTVHKDDSFYIVFNDGRIVDVVHD